MGSGRLYEKNQNRPLYGACVCDSDGPCQHHAQLTVQMLLTLRMRADELSLGGQLHRLRAAHRRYGAEPVRVVNEALAAAERELRSGAAQLRRKTTGTHRHPQSPLAVRMAYGEASAPSVCPFCGCTCPVCRNGHAIGHHDTACVHAEAEGD